MKNLRTRRKQAGLSQQALGEKTGISQAAISYIESGAHDPKYSTIIRMSMALGCFPEDLIGSSPSGQHSAGPAVADGKRVSHA